MDDRLGTTPYVDTAQRFRALRLDLRLTQEQLARRSNPTWPHVYAARVERGGLKLTRPGTVAAFAKGFGLEPADLERYLLGDLDLPTAIARCSRPAGAHEAPDPPVAALPEAPGGRQSVLDSALGAAFDSDRHAVQDLLSVRQSLATAPLDIFPAEGLVNAAERLLDASAALRLRGCAVTPEALALQVALGVN